MGDNIEHQDTIEASWCLWVERLTSMSTSLLVALSEASRDLGEDAVV
jgi:hypothetical protein